MQRLKDYLLKPISIAPLVMFRIIFGTMVFFSTLRFILKGWVTDLYVTPKYYFTYYGFDWVRPLSEIGMYAVFTLMLFASLGIILGFYYRLSAVLFFMLFTYVELLDKTNYLNHYYFVSLVSFLLILVPAGKYFALDVYFKKTNLVSSVPRWTVDIFKFQIGAVYFFAGVAKLNYHWLIEAQPLANWLKHQADMPLIGSFFKYKLTAYLFAWGGAIYDLSIPFILLSKKWRIYGYFLVIIFHILTAIMFPIGVFPYIMIGSTLIFFSVKFHQQGINLLSKFLNAPKNNYISSKTWRPFKPITSLIILFVVVQVFVPFRYSLYPGNLFWTEQGYRFSWRVMLIEKAGYAEFYIQDKNTKGRLVVDNSKYLTAQQEKMMATQPDMILQYAHFLRDNFTDSSWQEQNNTIRIENPIITVNSQVSLFNKGSIPFIDPTINLAEKKRGWHTKRWILPYE